MKTIEEVSELIVGGKTLFLAGSEKVLRKLPPGDWIAGTIPYFVTQNGGLITHDLIHATVLPQGASRISIVSYDKSNFHEMPRHYYGNGFTFIVMPAFSEVLKCYAENCTSWPGLFDQPVVGWVSGVDLKQNNLSPLVVNGRTLEFFQDRALAIHVELAPEFFAKADIINIFKPGQGDVITFPSSGFRAKTAIINGQERDFKSYLKEQKVDLQLPLVANYMGALVNVSFVSNEGKANEEVEFYAPVFAGVEYRLARPIRDYENEFQKAIKSHPFENSLFTCNCILNFVYANLEGKRIGSVSSPMTFGEIAYMLLNQTMVYVTIDRKDFPNQ
jgi:hypothetical protein